MDKWIHTNDRPVLIPHSPCTVTVDKAAQYHSELATILSQHCNGVELDLNTFIILLYDCAVKIATQLDDASSRQNSHCDQCDLYKFGDIVFLHAKVFLERPYIFDCESISMIRGDQLTSALSDFIISWLPTPELSERRLVFGLCLSAGAILHSITTKIYFHDIESHFEICSWVISKAVIVKSTDFSDPVRLDSMSILSDDETCDRHLEHHAFLDLFFTELYRNDSSDAFCRWSPLANYSLEYITNNLSLLTSASVFGDSSVLVVRLLQRYLPVSYLFLFATNEECSSNSGTVNISSYFQSIVGISTHPKLLLAVYIIKSYVVLLIKDITKFQLTPTEPVRKTEGSTSEAPMNSSPANSSPTPRMPEVFSDSEAAGPSRMPAATVSSTARAFAARAKLFQILLLAKDYSPLQEQQPAAISPSRLVRQLLVDSWGCVIVENLAAANDNEPGLTQRESTKSLLAQMLGLCVQDLMDSCELLDSGIIDLLNVLVVPRGDHSQVTARESQSCPIPPTHTHSLTTIPTAVDQLDAASLAMNSSSGLVAAMVFLHALCTDHEEEAVAWLYDQHLYKLLDTSTFILLCLALVIDLARKDTTRIQSERSWHGCGLVRGPLERPPLETVIYLQKVVQRMLRTETEEDSKSHLILCTCMRHCVEGIKLLRRRNSANGHRQDFLAGSPPVADSGPPAILGGTSAIYFGAAWGRYLTLCDAMELFIVAQFVSSGAPCLGAVWDNVKLLQLLGDSADIVTVSIDDFTVEELEIVRSQLINRLACSENIKLREAVKPLISRNHALAILLAESENQPHDSAISGMGAGRPDLPRVGGRNQISNSRSRHKICFTPFERGRYSLPACASMQLCTVLGLEMLLASTAAQSSRIGSGGAVSHIVNDYASWTCALVHSLSSMIEVVVAPCGCVGAIEHSDAVTDAIDSKAEVVVPAAIGRLLHWHWMKVVDCCSLGCDVRIPSCTHDVTVEGRPSDRSEAAEEFMSSLKCVLACIDVAVSALDIRGWTNLTSALFNTQTVGATIQSLLACAEMTLSCDSSLALRRSALVLILSRVAGAFADSMESHLQGVDKIFEANCSMVIQDDLASKGAAQNDVTVCEIQDSFVDNWGQEGIKGGGREGEQKREHRLFLSSSCVAAAIPLLAVLSTMRLTHPQADKSGWGTPMASSSPSPTVAAATAAAAASPPVLEYPLHMQQVQRCKEQENRILKCVANSLVKILPTVQATVGDTSADNVPESTLKSECFNSLSTVPKDTARLCSMRFILSGRGLRSPGETEALSVSLSDEAACEGHSMHRLSTASWLDRPQNESSSRLCSSSMSQRAAMITPTDECHTAAETLRTGVRIDKLAHRRITAFVPSFDLFFQSACARSPPHIKIAMDSFGIPLSTDNSLNLIFKQVVQMFLVLEFGGDRLMMLENWVQVMLRVPEVDIFTTDSLMSARQLFRLEAIRYSHDCSRHRKSFCGRCDDCSVSRNCSARIRFPFLDAFKANVSNVVTDEMRERLFSPQDAANRSEAAVGGAKLQSICQWTLSIWRDLPVQLVSLARHHGRTVELGLAEVLTDGNRPRRTLFFGLDEAVDSMLDILALVSASGLPLCEADCLRLVACCCSLCAQLLDFVQSHDEKYGDISHRESHYPLPAQTINELTECITSEFSSIDERGLNFNPATESRAVIEDAEDAEQVIGSYCDARDSVESTLLTKLKTVLNCSSTAPLCTDGWGLHHLIEKACANLHESWPASDSTGASIKKFMFAIAETMKPESESIRRRHSQRRLSLFDALLPMGYNQRRNAELSASLSPTRSKRTREGRVRRPGSSLETLKAGSAMASLEKGRGSTASVVAGIMGTPTALEQPSLMSRADSSGTHHSGARDSEGESSASSLRLSKELLGTKEIKQENNQRTVIDESDIVWADILKHSGAGAGGGGVAPSVHTSTRIKVEPLLQVEETSKPESMDDCTAPHALEGPSPALALAPAAAAAARLTITGGTQASSEAWHGNAEDFDKKFGFKSLGF